MSTTKIKALQARYFKPGGIDRKIRELAKKRAAEKRAG